VFELNLETRLSPSSRQGRKAYLTQRSQRAVCGPLDERRVVLQWQFCLDSPGVADKRDMLRLAAEAAGARRPVMVGDREPDLEAAQALGWPFVWRRNDRCDLGDSDAVWGGDPDELLALLGLPRLP